MKPNQLGIFIGLILGAIAFYGGFLAFLIAAVFAAIGWVAGMIIEGRLDLGALTGRGSDRR